MLADHPRSEHTCLPKPESTRHPPQAAHHGFMASHYNVEGTDELRGFGLPTRKTGKMKDKKLARCLATLVVCVLAIGMGMVALAGCSFGDPADSYKGVWVLTSLEDTKAEDDDTSGDDVVEYMDSMGLHGYLVLCDDGTCCYDTFGNVKTGTWETDDDGNATIDFDDDEIDSAELKLKDDTLTMTQGSSKMKFEAAEDDIATPDTAEDWESPNEKS
jgi:hypothetical protein